MTRRHSHLILLIFSILLLALAGGAVLLSRRMDRASALVAQGLARSLEREVVLGAVHWRPWGQVVVDGITLARWERLSEGHALRAERVTLTLDPLALLRRQVRIPRL